MPRVKLFLVGICASPQAMAVNMGTCGELKAFYRNNTCCGVPEKEINFRIIPDPITRMVNKGANPCEGQKEAMTKPAMDNIACWADAVRQAGEQAGGDVSTDPNDRPGTRISTNVTPIETPYYKTSMCPVNVHFHLGAEHRSKGQYDEDGKSPENAGLPDDDNPEAGRRLAGARYGYACHLYDATEATHTTEYDWKFCKDMHVGETYEVHWPHSSLGACGTVHQYQYPFYDGVFCKATAEILGGLSAQDIANNVGVQAQVFTIVNDEQYFYPNLIRGMIVDEANGLGEGYGQDVAVYTGSTTGTSRNNQMCSAYTPITWQVDRTCHPISASSFDKLCFDMEQMRDDMSGDMHPHGARELVWANLTADNLKNADVGR